MLKKIKKYKISLRPSFVLRNLKRKIDSKSETTPQQEAVDAELARAQSAIVPSTIYETFSRNGTPAGLQPVWDAAPKQAISVSLVVTTVGPALEKEIESAQGDPVRPAVLDAAGREGLEQSLNFVAKLLAEEAKQESCELSPLLPVPAELVPSALDLLESRKADIFLDDQNRLTPFFSAASYCFWNPLSKSAKNR